MGLFLAIALADFSFQLALKEDAIGEFRVPVLVLFLFEQFEVQFHAVLLAPLDELRLEVHLLVCHLVNVEQLLQDALLHEAHAGIVATVQIDGTHQGLERISTHVAVV